MAWSSKREGNDTLNSKAFYVWSCPRGLAPVEKLMLAGSQAWVLCGPILATVHLVPKLGTSFSLYCFLHVFRNIFAYPVIYLSTLGLNESFITKIAPMGFQPFFCLQIACEQIADTSNRFIIQKYWQFFIWVINRICKLFANISPKLLYIPCSVG